MNQSQGCWMCSMADQLISQMSLLLVLRAKTLEQSGITKLDTQSVVV